MTGPPSHDEHIAAKIPESVTLKVCPECGRTDRFTTLGDKQHSSGGKRCPGTPIRVEYHRV